MCVFFLSSVNYFIFFIFIIIFLIPKLKKVRKMGSTYSDINNNN